VRVIDPFLALALAPETLESFDPFDSLTASVKPLDVDPAFFATTATAARVRRCEFTALFYRAFADRAMAFARLTPYAPGRRRKSLPQADDARAPRRDHRCTHGLGDLR